MIRTGFFIILTLHAGIHLLGFVNGFQLTGVRQLKKRISKVAGLAWLLAALLLLLTALLFVMANTHWWVLGYLAGGISQLLIFTAWQDARFGSLVNIFLIAFSFTAFATTSYYNSYKKDVRTCFNQETQIEESVLTESDMASLPDAVKKYLRYTGVGGKPKVKNFRIAFEGKIRKNAQSEWMPFSSEQYNFINAPARLFFMKAVMKHLPVAGYHHFNNGKAVMDIRVLSSFKVQYQDGPEMDQSETVTYFNDMCCMAPATLIDKRITWLNTGGNKLKAAFTNNGITISAWLYFNEKGELVNFISNDRYAADVGKKLLWSTPLHAYKEINGYRLASYAEAIYSYPEGDLCYGTFNLKAIDYNSTNFK